MNQAWELQFEGKIEEEKKIVSKTSPIETCMDYTLLNLIGYIKLFEKQAIRSEPENLKTY